MKRIFFLRIAACIAMITLLPSSRAQYVRLTDGGSRSALYLNIGQLVNYNRYETWRFQAGLYWAIPNYANAPVEVRGPQWQLSAYGAYGLDDRGFKYGLQIARSYTGKHRWRPFVELNDDLVRVAASHIAAPAASLISDNNVQLVASHFARQQSVAFGTNATWNKYEIRLEGRYMRQQRLFDNGILCYPHRGEAVPESDHFLEGRLGVSLPGLTTDLRGGTSTARTEWVYARLLVQYESEWELLWNKEHRLEWALHTGLAAGLHTDRKRVLQRMMECFDMGGAYNHWIYMRTTLLTLPPEQFYADGFMRTMVRYRFGEPLWQLRWTTPQPFVQATALVGHHSERGPWSAVAEPAIGSTGLLRWGTLDLGCALAFQAFNRSSGDITLRPDSRHKRWAFVVCVTNLLGKQIKKQNRSL